MMILHSWQIHPCQKGLKSRRNRMFQQVGKKLTLLASWHRLHGGWIKEPVSAQQALALPLWYNSNHVRIKSNTLTRYKKLRSMLGTATIADIAAAGVGFFIDTTPASNARAR